MKHVEETAMHEAGHVVANLEFGFRFEVVTLDRGGSGEVDLWQGQRPKNIREAERWTMALFAGYVAEHVLLGKELMVDGGDWWNCRNSVLPLFQKELRFDAFTNKMLQRTVHFVQSRSSEIRRVAGVLIARHRLSEQEVRDILNQMR